MNTKTLKRQLTQARREERIKKLQHALASPTTPNGLRKKLKNNLKCLLFRFNNPDKYAGYHREYKRKQAVDNRVLRGV